MTLTYKNRRITRLVFKNWPRRGARQRAADAEAGGARPAKTLIAAASSGMAKLQGSGQIALERLRRLAVDQLAEQIESAASWRLSCCTVSMRRESESYR